MTKKLCTSNCLYAVDGRCRLEHRYGERFAAVCPHYEGYLRHANSTTVF
ncbi:MAG: cleavage protein [Desulfitobacteriaceae bacterium]